jgi:hypothetical protein
VGNFALIDPGLLFRIHHDQLLDVKMPVIRPGNHGGMIVAGVSANQYRSTGHFHFLPPPARAGFL